MYKAKCNVECLRDKVFSGYQPR